MQSASETLRSILEAFIQLTVDWSSVATQSEITRAAQVDVEVSDLALLYLLGLSGRQRQGNLANELRQSAPTTSKQVSRLESLGYVERHIDPTDSRAVLVSLSPEGESAVSRLNAPTEAGISAALETIPASDRALFTSHLLTFISALRAQ
ncbi:MarR family winged helix-turn-helix transcriptional regulator [Rhodococcus sp. (in: high G+C Gram-positive bacteria)]|uniref:MarR family winged helix-turn-helix transcriptional regulator n=1 Tax=Rhodococcus sp. TaxID=1831 RepID=UPI00338D3F38